VVDKVTLLGRTLQDIAFGVPREVEEERVLFFATEAPSLGAMKVASPR
jgi:hypothetical protein